MLGIVLLVFSRYVKYDLAYLGGSFTVYSQALISFQNSLYLRDFLVCINCQQ